MDVKLLKRFLDLCETKNFTKTAGNLFLSQQALSSSVRALEEELGKPLFKRTPTGLVLTDEGAYLKKVCAPVVQNFDNMVLELEQYFHEQAQILLFGLAPGVLQASSADLIFKFRTACPNYEVRGVEGADIVCLEYVLDGSVELAFCARPPEEPAIRYIPVGEERLYAVVNRASSLAGRAEIGVDDLKGQRLVSLNRFHQIHHRICGLCHSCGFSPEFVVETGEISTLLGLVKLNEYVFICMEHVAEEIDQTCCAAIPLTGTDAVWEYGLIHRKDHHLSLCAKRFISFVKNNSVGNIL